MSYTVTLTDEGKLLACRLIAEHLDWRRLGIERVTALSNAQIMRVLICYGAMQTESRQELWFRRQMDEILELPAGE